MLNWAMNALLGRLLLYRRVLKFRRRSVVAGNPGKIIKEVSDEMLAWKTEGTKLYQALPAR